MHVKVNPIRTREEVRPLRKSQETIVQTEVGTFTDARDAAHDLICLDVTEQVPDVSYLTMNQRKVKHIQLEKEESDANFKVHTGYSHSTRHPAQYHPPGARS